MCGGSRKALSFPSDMSLYSAGEDGIRLGGNEFVKVHAGIDCV